MPQQLDLTSATLDDIGAEVVAESTPPAPDPRVQGELNVFDQESVANSRQNRAQRREYAPKLYWLAVGWLIALMVFVFASGVRLELNFWTFVRGTWALSEGVVLAMIGGTTAKVLVLFYFVIRYLFHRADHQPPKHN